MIHKSVKEALAFGGGVCKTGYSPVRLGAYRGAADAFCKMFHPCVLAGHARSLLFQLESSTGDLFFICVLSGKRQGILQTTTGRISDFEMDFRQILPAALIHNRQRQLFLWINQEGWPRAALPAKFSNRAVGTGFGPVHQWPNAITVALGYTLESRSFLLDKIGKTKSHAKIIESGTGFLLSAVNLFAFHFSGNRRKGPGGTPAAVQLLPGLPAHFFAGNKRWHAVFLLSFNRTKPALLRMASVLLIFCLIDSIRRWSRS